MRVMNGKILWERMGMAEGEYGMMCGRAVLFGGSGVACCEVLMAMGA